MRDRCFFALIERLDLARIRQASLFLHRQGVQFGPHQNHWPFAIAQYSDHARLPDALGNLEPEIAQLAGELLRGVDFFERQFGMGVDVLVQRFNVRVVTRDLIVDFLAVPLSDGGRLSLRRGDHQEGESHLEDA